MPDAMGQPISVVRKPSSKPNIVRFEINRSLTGMGHERFCSPSDVTGDRPPDELARRLFDRGGIRCVHIYSNVITVELQPDSNADGIDEIIRDLYIHYKPGVAPSFAG
jgi:hypothetical protein